MLGEAMRSGVPCHLLLERQEATALSMMHSMMPIMQGAAVLQSAECCMIGGAACHCTSQDPRPALEH